VEEELLSIQRYPSDGIPGTSLADSCYRIENGQTFNESGHCSSKSQELCHNHWNG
jgi:hypothetical protein